MDPRDNPCLFGHEAAEAVMLDAIQSGRLHHAWLMTGPAGIGKATLAFRFARRLLADGNTGGGGPGLFLPPADPVFRRVAAGTHADLLTVERAFDEKRRRTRAEIVVEDVRAVADFLRLTPAEGGWRIVVVDGAEHLNRNAANALLKMLEEPPRRALLLLACAAPGRLLPTIRSRCRRLRLLPLPEPAMREALAAVLPDVSPPERDRLAMLAEGSPGRAQALAEEGGVAMASLVSDLLDRVPRVPPQRAYELADLLGKTEGGFTTFMELLRTAIAAGVRQAARGAAGGQEPWLASRPLEAWGDVWHALTQLHDETERFNLDKRQALVSGLSLLNGS